MLAVPYNQENCALVCIYLFIYSFFILDSSINTMYWSSLEVQMSYNNNNDSINNNYSNIIVVWVVSTKSEKLTL